MINKLLTQALVFKPKKLVNTWEHKRGFQVIFDCNTALRIIENKRSTFGHEEAKKMNYHLGKDYGTLRDLAVKRLYNIESIQNNYIDFICLVFGLIISVYTFELMYEIWNYPSQFSVRLFFILIAILVFLLWLYKRKSALESYLVVDFLNIEDALFSLENGESQYQVRRK
ncbi:hypothetical protein L313_2787 [Acinetobacter haemolyticus CIP 64.3 = MTCC 9819]|uniref:Uncharacterized protein n=1 Tax=Acinetobacter haemolyticus CIP 64.3 = MTCC 9819 TaxID=1217659 RepID=N9GET7_ACIHA|nr:hypothetical protein [Acinetobacter haemolyticus]ENW15604.1 hypothetical protein F927_03344 [Acinetobacter haemolyticus CIP 64.3 = MTCC 9819]EPR90377.1 hypothetical protein L313_2787 [Acinetobacter haemolyticus CIP 64.3 = MTCC 9819]QXZ26484.1 hypothetical protein I6L22_15140 [Acinetobacter haemolyticus]SPT48673.1 Uncharacterised protein [Acinetobacter haemolyticus]SUU61871.1 Uncharacterised protein [Acinetobacter haemolyticus]